MCKGFLIAGGAGDARSTCTLDDDRESRGAIWAIGGTGECLKGILVWVRLGLGPVCSLVGCIAVREVVA